MYKLSLLTLSCVPNSPNRICLETNPPPTVLLDLKVMPGSRLKRRMKKYRAQELALSEQYIYHYHPHQSLSCWKSSLLTAIYLGAASNPSISSPTIQSIGQAYASAAAQGSSGKRLFVLSNVDSRAANDSLGPEPFPTLSSKSMSEILTTVSVCLSVCHLAQVVYTQLLLQALRHGLDLLE